MNTNDQWFEAGDKVMRVSNWNPGGLVDGSKEKPFGHIFCVEYSFQSCVGMNGVKFVGVQIPALASNFRRIEEIKLCVEAAAKMKQPKKNVEPITRP